MASTDPMMLLPSTGYGALIHRFDYLEETVAQKTEKMYYRSMNDPLDGLESAVTTLRVAWIGADAAAPADTVVPAASGDECAGAGPASELSRQQLVAVLERIGAVGRRLDGVRAQVAAELDRQSRSELGADSLAKQQGYRNPVQLIAAVTGVGAGDAKRLVAVGKAIQPRTTLVGEQLPPRRPHVAAAVEAATITSTAAGIIIAMLERVVVRACAQDREDAERILVESAPGLSVDDLRRLVCQAEAWLDQDGVEPAERDRRGQRYLRLWERDGFVHLDAKLDAATGGASVKAAIEGIVSAAFREGRDDVVPADDQPPAVVQRQADALVQLAEHGLGCDRGDLPLAGATVVVRMALETLRNGEGLARIDGITPPISAQAAAHHAATADVIPVVLDSEGEILHWGRRKRLFTPAQKLALVERDGGCAMCHLPPGMTKAHHLNWWKRDHGRTNIDEGVLLCESCHHRIHDNGWDIRIVGHGTKAEVWFLPPPAVDPARSPRLGGRARFDYARAG